MNMGRKCADIWTDKHVMCFCYDRKDRLIRVYFDNEPIESKKVKTYLNQYFINESTEYETLKNAEFINNIIVTGRIPGFEN